MHRPGEDHARQYPQHAGQVAHLRGEHGPDQRPGAGDGGKVVAKQHVFIGRNVVQAIVVARGRCRTAGVQRQHTLGDEQAVVAVGNQVHRYGGNNYPQRVNGLAAVQGDGRQRAGARQRDQRPDAVACQTIR